MIPRWWLPFLLMGFSPILALESSRGPDWPGWKRAAREKIWVEPTRIPWLDDALQTGFALHWKGADWAWMSDTVSSDPVGKGELRLRFSPQNRFVDRSPSGECPHWRQNTGWFGCLDRDSSYLHLVVADENGLLLHDITSIHRDRANAGLAVDVVADLREALVLASGNPPSGVGIENTALWPDLCLNLQRRAPGKATPLWVPTTMRGEVDSATWETILDRPVRWTSPDSLDHLLGGSTPGAYLHVQVFPKLGSILRVRDLETGKPLVASPGADASHAASLTQEDLEGLALAMQAKERRETWSFDLYHAWMPHSKEVCVEGSGEVRRGIQAMVGICNQQNELADAAEKRAEVGLRIVTIAPWPNQRPSWRSALTLLYTPSPTFSEPVLEGEEVAVEEDHWSDHVSLRYELLNFYVMQLGLGARAEHRKFVPTFSIGFHWSFMGDHPLIP